MEKLFKTVKEHYLLVIFLIIYFLVTSYKFVAYPTPFYDWDEAIYAQVGREMVKAKSVVPLWQGKFWLDKPPLVPLAYGIVETIAPLPPEISTRIFTLLLSTLVLVFVYALYWKVNRDKASSFLAVVITAFFPIFLQRTQVLNVDVFLLLGWTGYVLFYERYWISLFFLAVGVLSKSLLGFYPPLMLGLFFSYQYLIRRLDFRSFKKKLFFILTQISVLLMWYVLMFVFFKGDFINAHFLDSHLKRITASIESHFGQRTFYLDVLLQEFGSFKIFILGGILLIIYEYLRKRDEKKFFQNLFFVPWFIFLNLTKTKIAWYLYAILPQFALLASYPLLLLKKTKYGSYGLAILVTAFLIYVNFKDNGFFKTQYSSYDKNYHISRFAKDNCKSLLVLVDPDTRKTHEVLSGMNLLIRTSSWWGNHPSIVYYFGKEMEFIYNVTLFKEKALKLQKDDCILIDKEDRKAVKKDLFINEIKAIDNLFLLKR
jgi:4-amino-4-deoxy-L-arabinose transferase-like glycosyltransferase